MDKEYFVDVPEESAPTKTYFTETATPSGSTVDLPKSETESYYISQERFVHYRESATFDFSEEYELEK
jgi:hypothetical protein